MIDKDELHTLIPHRGKMLLLSRVIEYNEGKSIRAEFDITEDCLFYDSAAGGVPAWAGFEFMAQTISAFSGIRDRDMGKKPKIGFILSIPSVRIYFPIFKSGSTVEIFAKECDCTDMIYTFEGEVFQEGKKVIEGKIMVMEISDKRLDSLIKEYVN